MTPESEGMRTLFFLISLALGGAPLSVKAKSSGKPEFDAFVKRMAELRRAPVHFSGLVLNRKAKRLSNAERKEYRSKNESK